MNEPYFKDRHRQRWQELENILDTLDAHQANNALATKVPSLFRQIATDLSLAQHRMSGNKLCQALNTLVMRCYQQMNGGVGDSTGIWKYSSVTFPRAVRKEWRLVLLGFLLFAVPFAAMVISTRTSPDWIYSCLSPGEMAAMDQMYGDSAESVAHSHRPNGDLPGSFGAFAFYVEHNISIGLRSFALGALATVGAVYELVWEGIKLGAMFGYVHHTGNSDKIWQFAISHSSFELLGLCICATAGIRLGLGIIIPGRRTRAESFRETAKQSMPLLFGGVGMVFTAAIVEGFWSPQPFIPVNVKFAFGLTMWALWLCYFCFAGRERHAR